MHGATPLLIVNFSIGLFFAAAFIEFARRSEIRLGYWCAGGFLAAAATEALAPYFPWARLTSFLSFTFFLLALTLIAAG